MITLWYDPHTGLRCRQQPSCIMLSLTNLLPTLLVFLVLADAVAQTQEPSSSSCLSPSFSAKLSRKQTLRMAQFNIALFRDKPGQLQSESRFPNSTQLQLIAATLQHIDADIVLLNEFDHDATYETYININEHYFQVPQTQYFSSSGLDYPHVYAPPSNTGLLSGVDINKDGKVELPEDAFGYGLFEGQYAFVVFSKYPIMKDEIRTFQRFLWKNMPNNRIPNGVFTDNVIDVFRLSSKNHADIPIALPSGRIIHLLASHPTPPGFDSAADENGRRNADEIRFWADYITPQHSGYIYDDAGVTGGLKFLGNTSDDVFFVAGDQNSEPYDGDSIKESIGALLSRYNVVDPRPRGEGGMESEHNPPGSAGNPAFDTFFSPDVGNLRLDYIIPSDNVDVINAQVFWPSESDPLAVLTNGTQTSDHRAIFVDVIA